jgi:CBS domain-containing protein
MALKAKDIMTRLVVMAKEDASLEEVVRTMRERNISGMPVVDEEGKLTGIVAKDDFLYRAPRHWEAVRKNTSPDRDGQGSPPTVGELMTRQVISAGEESTIHEVAALMWERRIHRIPICNGDGVLTGIVSSLDLCRALGVGKVD